MPRQLQLGVLDQVPVPEGMTAPEALRETIALAQLTDGLGYVRYWLAEHHNHPGLASPAPEVLIPAIAAATGRIRVGSGGVMLPHYSPLHVAEQFRVLEALYPAASIWALAVRRAATRTPRWRSTRTRIPTSSRTRCRT